MGPTWKGRLAAEAPDPVFLSSSSAPEYDDLAAELQDEIEAIRQVGDVAMAAVGRDRLLRVYVERMVARYAAIDPAALAMIEGHS
jgi:hypothetical protein